MASSREGSVSPGSVSPLTKTQLKNLESHKYSCAGKSLLEWPLQYFWNWLVQFVPASISPNTLTVAGLVLNTLSTLVLFYYSPHASEEAPSWVYLLCGLSFFIYQALDAIDGKHARLTESSTPLGELFDHGCDSVSLAFVGLAVPCSMRLGDYPHYLIIYYLATLVVFYCAHWRTYICGKLEFSFIDVTEAQLAMIGVHLISGIFGPGIWRVMVVSSWGIDVQFLLLSVSVIAVSISVVQSVQIVMEGGPGKNGSTIAESSVLSPSIPMLLVVLFSYYTYVASPARILQTEPVIAGLLYGVVFAKLSINLVIAHMSKSAMVLLDSIMLAPFAVFVNIYIGVLLPEFAFTLLALLYTSFDVFKTCYLVCQQICAHLDIYCFSTAERAAH